MNSPNQQASYGQIPLSFIANAGQTDPNVKFQVKGAGHSIYFTPNEITFTAFQKPNEPGNAATNSATVRSSLANSNPNPTISGLEKLPGFANFILGEDSSQWHTEVPTFNGVIYHSVYQGIDRIFKGKEGQLKSEFLVAAFADPSQIKMNYTGVNSIRLRDDGALTLETPLGELIDNAPIVYQDINGQRVNVPAAYNLLGNGQVGFSLGEFDRTQPLVIDPVLAYSTYLGGSRYDQANNIAVDSTGAAYIIGTTFNGSVTNDDEFPTTPGAYQTTAAEYQEDFFITKINPEGTALVYSTYIGGSGEDFGLAIAVDSQGNAYLAGQVEIGAGVFGSPFPTTTGALQPNITSEKNRFSANLASVTKLNATGNALVYSSILGLSGNSSGKGIAVDSEGNAYVTGDTDNDYRITPGASQPTRGSLFDVFITKVNPTGSGLIYSTYLGGSEFEDAGDIAVDSAGNAFVTGTTYSTDFPVNAPLQDRIGGKADAFVAKFDANGTRIYSTYLGGSDSDLGTDIAVDSAENAYIVGFTSSTNFPTASPIQAANAGGTYDAFVSKVSPGGNSLIYSTYLGGSADDIGNGVTADSENNVYVVGVTTSTNFPTNNAIQSVSGGGEDAFVTKINSSGSALVDSTYLGGSGNDYGRAIAVDTFGAVYVAGDTTSTNFPIVNPLQVAKRGDDYDIFIAKLIPGEPQVKIIDNNPAVIITPINTSAMEGGGNSIIGTNDNDTFTAGSNNDFMSARRGNDLFDGGWGNDTIYGGKDNDTLLGNSNDDILFGNLGNDLLNGGDGNDFLSGGFGDDTSIGGLGSDRFLLFTDSGIDTIVDFAVGTDLLILGDGLTFSQLAIVQDSGATLIRTAQNGKILANLSGVFASSIGAANFGSTLL